MTSDQATITGHNRPHGARSQRGAKYYVRSTDVQRVAFTVLRMHLSNARAVYETQCARGEGEGRNWTSRRQLTSYLAFDLGGASSGERIEHGGSTCSQRTIPIPDTAQTTRGRSGGRVVCFVLKPVLGVAIPNVTICYALLSTLLD
jgi:hypothetical protein